MAHAKKRSTAAAKGLYKTRQHAGERPFSMMKCFFGADQFLTRGLDRVSQEYDWLSAGVNLHRLMSLPRHSTGPPHPAALALYPSLSPSTRWAPFPSPPLRKHDRGGKGDHGHITRNKH